jgi:ATP-dependent exoDNAse (exonuclease V) beta subunit
MHERYPEQFFHAAIHLLFTYMGLRVHSEVHTSDGRVDAVVETDTRVYILEFKLDRSAEEALAQIRTKKYYQAWWHLGKPVVGIGVNFSSETKNVEAWEAEEME